MDAYSELEHPADLFLEIRGPDLPGLLENALFAFYDQIAEIGGFEPRRELTLSVREPRLDEAFRSLLSGALYRFDTEGFVAAGGEVTVEKDGALPAAAGTPAALGGCLPGAGSACAAPRAYPVPLPAPRDWHLVARLWGESAERGRHTLLHEVKAVTYHRLSVSEGRDGWRATVLLDI